MYEKLWKELMEFFEKIQDWRTFDGKFVVSKMKWMELIEDRRRKDEEAEPLHQRSTQATDEETSSKV